MNSFNEFFGFLMLVAALSLIITGVMDKIFEGENIRSSINAFSSLFGVAAFFLVFWLSTDPLFALVSGLIVWIIIATTFNKNSLKIKEERKC